MSVLSNFLIFPSKNAQGILLYHYFVYGRLKSKHIFKKIQIYRGSVEYAKTLASYIFH